MDGGDWWWKDTQVVPCANMGFVACVYKVRCGRLVDITILARWYTTCRRWRRSHLDIPLYLLSCKDKMWFFFSSSPFSIDPAWAHWGDGGGSLLSSEGRKQPARGSTNCSLVAHSLKRWDLLSRCAKIHLSWLSRRLVTSETGCVCSHVQPGRPGDYSPLFH